MGIGDDRRCDAHFVSDSLLAVVADPEIGIRRQRLIVRDGLIAYAAPSQTEFGHGNGTGAEPRLLVDVPSQRKRGE